MTRRHILGVFLLSFSPLACVNESNDTGPEIEEQPISESTAPEHIGTATEALYLATNLSPWDPRWSFQGAWQFDDCGQVNHVGNGAWQNNAPLQCPGKTVTGTRALMPESKCGGNQYQCENPGFSFSSSLKFGGLYQVDDCGINHVGNAMQSGGLGCPYGYWADKVGRVMTPESKCGALQYVCDARPNESTGNPLQDKYRWGGQYQVDDCGGNTRSNPLTGAPNCPTNYYPVAYGRVLGPETKCGVNQFVCVGKEP
jgi:hypothetical protein